jgi:hypothetical protein
MLLLLLYGPLSACAGRVPLAAPLVPRNCAGQVALQLLFLEFVPVEPCCTPAGCVVRQPGPAAPLGWLQHSHLFGGCIGSVCVCVTAASCSSTTDCFDTQKKGVPQHLSRVAATIVGRGCPSQ